MRVHDSVNDRFVALAYGKLPLLSWLGAGFVFLGVEPLDAVRIVSIAAGATSLVLAGLLAARLGGTSAGILAAAVYSVLPLAFVHDVIGIMEPLVAALLVAALYLQMRLAERPEWTTAFLLGFVLGGGLLAKETGEIALVLFPASLLLFDWRPEERLRRLALWLGCALTAMALAGLAYLVLTLSELWDDYPKARESLGTFRSLGDGLSHPLRWIGGEWPEYRTEWLGYTTTPIALAVAAGVVFALRRHGRLATLYVLWLLVPLVVDFLFLPNAFARYLVPMAPLLAVFAAYGLLCAGRTIARYARRPHRVGLITGALGLVVLSSALVFDGQVLAEPATAPYPGSSREEYATGGAAGTGWRELAAELKRRAAPGQIEVVWYEGVSEALSLLLRDEPNVAIVRGQPGSTGPGSAADYLVQNGTPLPAEHGLGSIRPVWIVPPTGGWRPGRPLPARSCLGRAFLRDA